MSDVVEPGQLHPGTEHLLQFFANKHLKHPLRSISQPFEALAYDMLEWVGEGPETTAGLRKLLEAKDCFVRAAVSNLPTADKKA